jgi:hypothetical protein
MSYGKNLLLPILFFCQSQLFCYLFTWLLGGTEDCAVAGALRTRQTALYLLVHLMTAGYNAT